jgi:hypothetical protein
MPNMPGTVTKTRTFTAMDAFWSADPAQFMADYDSSGFAALLVDAVNKNLISQAVADHVTHHWLNQYWPTAEARDVLHRGLYWAMRVAVHENAGGPNETTRAAPLPICCAWICSGGKPKNGKARFEVISIESAQQVTLLFLTPSPTGLWGDEPIGPYQPIWATRHIHFPVDNGEHQLEQWGPTPARPTTRTVRPHDYEDYRPKP